MGIEIAVGNIAAPTGGATVDLTVPGFGTLLLAKFRITRGVTNGTVADHAVLGYGATDGTRQWACGIQSENATTISDNDRFSTVSACIELLNAGASSKDGSLSFNSIITDGIRLNVDNAFASGYRIGFVFFKGDDVSVRAGSVDMTSAVNVGQSIIAPDFEPHVVEMLTISHATETISTAEAQIAHGFAINDGSETQRSALFQERNGVGDSRATGIMHDDRILSGTTTAGTITYEIEVTAFGASGWTITPRVAAANMWAFYTAIRCPSNTVSLVTHAAPTTEGNQSNTTLTFKPQYLEFLYSRQTSVNSLTTNDNAVQFGGAAITVSSQTSYCTTVDDGAGVTDSQSMADNIAVNAVDHIGADEYKAISPTFNADGWTLNFSSVRGSASQWAGLTFEENAGGGTTRNLSMSATIASMTPSVDGVLDRKLSMVLAQVSTTPSIDLSLTRNLSAPITIASTTPSVDGMLDRRLSVSSSALSLTPAVDSVLNRALSLDTTIPSFTPDIDISISGNRQLTLSVNISSTTPDLDSILDRALGMSLSLGSTTPNVDVILQRALSGSLSFSSTTPDIALLLDRALSFSFNTVSTTPSVDLILDRILSMAFSVVSLTPDIDIDLSGSRLLTMSLSVDSLTPNVDAVVQRNVSLQSNVSSSTPNIESVLSRALTLSVALASLTPDIDIDISGARLLAMSLSVLSNTPEIDALLNRAISLQSLIASVTPGINLILDRSLTFSTSMGSATPDVDAVLTNFRALSMAIESQSLTPDVDNILTRELGLSALCTSLTPDIDTMLSRILAMSIDVASLTPDDVVMVLGGLGVIVNPGVVTLTRSKNIVQL